MPMIIQIDDDKHQAYTLSVYLLDEAIKKLIKDGNLSAQKMSDAIETAKDELLELNKNNDDNLLKMAIFMNANTLQCRYLEMEHKP